MVSFGKKKKPSMHSGKTVVIDQGENSSSEDSYEISKTADTFTALNKFVKFTLWSIIVCVIIAGLTSIIVLATVSAAIPMDDGTRAVVLRNEYNVNNVPQRAVLLVSSKRVDDTVLGRLDQSFSGVAGESIVAVIGGPNAPIETKNGQLYIDDKPTGLKATVKKQYLDQTYIAQCIEGSCNAGELVYVPTSNIIGTVKSKLDGYTNTEYEATIKN